MKKTTITIVLGTAREGRKSEHVSNYIMEVAGKREDATYSLVDVKDHLHGHTIPPWEESDVTQQWREIVKNTDAFVFIVPEYNHGYPGELKMLLDQELKAYIGKPVLIAGVSAGRLGGARVIEHIQPVLGELGLVYIPYSLMFPGVGDLFDESGKITDDVYERRVNRSLDNLVVYTKSLHGIADKLTGHK